MMTKTRFFEVCKTIEPSGLNPLHRYHFGRVRANKSCAIVEQPVLGRPPAFQLLPITQKQWVVVLLSYQTSRFFKMETWALSKQIVSKSYLTMIEHPVLGKPPVSIKKILTMLSNISKNEHCQSDQKYTYLYQHISTAAARHWGRRQSRWSFLFIFILA